MDFHYIFGFRLVSALFMAALIILSGCFMLACTGCSDQTDAPVTEPPATEAPVTEAPVTEAPVTEAPVTEAPVTEPPVTEPVSKENFSWRNTSVVFVGDSMTAGTGTTKTYHSYLRDMDVFKSVRALGVGGSCISYRSDYGLKNSPLIGRYTSIPSADLIVIFMGSNDYGHETPLGTISDTSDVSFYGALNVVITGIRKKHPDSQLVFITPIHRYGFGTSKILGTPFTYDSLPNGRGHSLEDYVNAIKAVCDKYALPVIDLFSLYPINPENPDDKQQYFPDGLHLNAAGHEIIAKAIFDQLALIPRRG